MAVDVIHALSHHSHRAAMRGIGRSLALGHHRPKFICDFERPCLKTFLVTDPLDKLQAVMAFFGSFSDAGEVLPFPLEGRK